MKIIFDWLSQATRTKVSFSTASVTWFITVHTDSINTSLLDFFELISTCLLACEVLIQDVAWLTLGTFIDVTLALRARCITLITSF